VATAHAAADFSSSLTLASIGHAPPRNPRLGSSHPNSTAFPAGRLPPSTLASPEDALQIRAGLVIDLHELDRRPADLDEGDCHATAGTIRLDDDVMALESSRKVVDLECHMRHRLDQVRVRRVFPVPLPLNTEGII